MEKKAEMLNIPASQQNSCTGELGILMLNEGKNSKHVDGQFRAAIQ